jgi:aryl-alcohol dehydrogenase-like predicted oxidoreductase
VTPIGFGAFKIGRNVGVKYPSGYDLPDDRAVERLLNGVLDLGINFIDTAPAYGLSEERIGRAIAHRRDEFVISTKVGETFENGRSHFDFSRKAVEQSIARSCERLRRDVLDLVFVHSDGRDLDVIESTDVLPSLRSLRDAGTIRAIGFSGKTVDGARAAMSLVDVLMVEYHLEDRAHEQVIREAHDRGIGVVIKKGLGSGRLAPHHALPFLLGNHSITSVVVGGLDLQHIRENVELAEHLTGPG